MSEDIAFDKATHQIFQACVFHVTNEQIDDLLAGAFEGGINYWCAEIVVVGKYPKGAEFGSQVISRGGTIRLKLNEEDKELEEGMKLLTLQTALIGIKMASAHVKKSVDEFIENQDAESADMVVQFAVFGKLIFG